MRPLRPVVLLASMLVAPELCAESSPPDPRVSVRLTYIPGPGASPCEDARGFTRQLEHYLGYNPVQSDAELSLTVMVSREPGKVSIFVALHGKDGKQIWADRHDSKLTCDDALQSVALKGVMECERYLREHPPPPAASAPKVPERAKPPEAPECPTPQEAAAPARDKLPTPPRALTPALPPIASLDVSRRRSWEIGLGVETALKLFPAQALGGFASFGLRWPRWSGTIEGHFVGALQSDVVPDVQAFFMGATLAAPCVHWKAFFGCTVATVGGYIIPSAPVAVKDGQASLAALGLRVGGQDALAGPLALRAFVEVAGVPAQQRVNDQGPRWVVPPFHASFGFAIQILPWNIKASP